MTEDGKGLSVVLNACGGSSTTQETNRNKGVPHNARGSGGPGIDGKNQVTECLKAKREEGKFKHDSLC